MGFLPLPGWVPLRCNSRCIPSPFRGGFSDISGFVFYFLLCCCSNVRLPHSTPKPHRHLSLAWTATADGEVPLQRRIRIYQNRGRINRFFFRELKIDLGQQIMNFQNPHKGTSKKCYWSKIEIACSKTRKWLEANVEHWWETLTTYSGKIANFTIYEFLEVPIIYWLIFWVII